ncbi:TPA: hypothetical protein HA318_00615 [Candidatus Micrarchaeota archaeon]|nr:hypothetical protein [Candidatus Micrarchaeota archaeon]
MAKPFVGAKELSPYAFRKAPIFSTGGVGEHPHSIFREKVGLVPGSFAVSPDGKLSHVPEQTRVAVQNHLLARGVPYEVAFRHSFRPHDAGIRFNAGKPSIPKAALMQLVRSRIRGSRGR